jgi:hypothetical protein
LLVAEVDVVRTVVHCAPRPYLWTVRPAIITYNQGGDGGFVG